MFKNTKGTGLETVSFDPSEVVRGINRELRGSHDMGLRRLTIETASAQQVYFALARYLMNDHIIPKWLATRETQSTQKARKVHYLSLEFLIGRALSNNVINLGLDEKVRKAITSKCPNFSFDQLEEQDHEAGLGNGGLGRLAACFLESGATHDLPLDGFGLWYEKGIFEQMIRDGEQKEKEDEWLKNGGYRWKVIDKTVKPFRVKLGGRVDRGDNGRLHVVDDQNNPKTQMYFRQYMVPIVGADTNTVNTLNLWRPDFDSMQFDMDRFNKEDHAAARQNEVRMKNICAQLYPNDKTEKGQELRLTQEFTLCSTSLQLIIAEYKKNNSRDGFVSFAAQNAVHINDTHPALAVPELMRLLIDEETIAVPEKEVLALLNEFNIPDAYQRVYEFFESVGQGMLLAKPNGYQLLRKELKHDKVQFEKVWEKYQKIVWNRAWEITRSVIGYTNHTVMAEAMEKWPRALVQRLLPRQEQIIGQINDVFLKDLMQKFPSDVERMKRMSIYGDDHGVEKVRMANLSIVGGYSVNGVAALHTDILKASVLKDFYEMYPERFHNVTNGVTPRRWIRKANPELANLITELLDGNEWVKDLSKLKDLEKFVNDDAVLGRLLAIKADNKRNFAEYIHKHNPIRDAAGVEVDTYDVNPISMFIDQSKRLHEYKRQLLTALYIHSLYNQIKADPSILAREDFVPKTFFFGAKAAPGYDMAKNIIKYITMLGRTINNDPLLEGKLNVVYLENYNVASAEKMIPSADISLQISTAGLEASGTGNMKYSMNGALTVGTMDGANVEMAEHIEKENMFIFGALTPEVEKMVKDNSYHPNKVYDTDPTVHKVLNDLWAGSLARENDAREKEVLKSIADSLMNYSGGQKPDKYFVLYDFASFAQAMDESYKLYLKPREWAQKMLLNIARMGFFTSDRSIWDYAKNIWGLKPVQVVLPEAEVTETDAE